jgi:hypothetical protein
MITKMLLGLLALLAVCVYLFPSALAAAVWQLTGVLWVCFCYWRFS